MRAVATDAMARAHGLPVSQERLHAIAALFDGDDLAQGLGAAAQAQKALLAHTLVSACDTNQMNG